jgi:hypothetical protein
VTHEPVSGSTSGVLYKQEHCSSKHYSNRVVGVFDQLTHNCTGAVAAVISTSNGSTHAQCAKVFDSMSSDASVRIYRAL